MRTVACPSCRSFCRVPADASPDEEFACPDCGTEATLGTSPESWAEVGVAATAASRRRVLPRFDPIEVDRPARREDAPGVAFHGLVGALGLAIGYFGYFAASEPFPSAQASDTPVVARAAK